MKTAKIEARIPKDFSGSQMLSHLTNESLSLSRIPFPLTPALSPGERGQHLRHLDVSNSPPLSKGGRRFSLSAGERAGVRGKGTLECEKLNPQNDKAPYPVSAFTMIEIAICLAVIGFALAAIIGILPLGLSVQRENREETVINQDGNVFVNAFRNGELGLDDLTNYVTAITNTWALYRDQNPPVRIGGVHVNGYTYTNSTSGGSLLSGYFPLTNGFGIVGLLSTPRYVRTTVR